jgi:hypothetical protein
MPRGEGIEGPAAWKASPDRHEDLRNNRDRSSLCVHRNVQAKNKHAIRKPGSLRFGRQNRRRRTRQDSSKLAKVLFSGSPSSEGGRMRAEDSAPESARSGPWERDRQGRSGRKRACSASYTCFGHGASPSLSVPGTRGTCAGASIGLAGAPSSLGREVASPARLGGLEKPPTCRCNGSRISREARWMQVPTILQDISNGFHGSPRDATARHDLTP